MMNEVKTYFLSPEELKRRQDQIKKRNPLFQPKKPNLYEYKVLTKPRYLKLQEDGMTDKEIVEKITWLSESKLTELKKKWKL